MKILFLSSSLAPHFGGAAISESSLSAELCKEHDVVVLSRQDRLDVEFAKKQGIRKVIPFSPVSVLCAFFNSRHPLTQEIKASTIFHLNGHWYWENYFFARLCCRYKVPYVLHPRGMLWAAYRRPRLKKLFNMLLGSWIVSHASKIILLSEFEKKQIEGYPVDESKLAIIPNGINSVEKLFQINRKISYFLYLGRLEPRKNLEFLIRTFKKVHEISRTSILRLVGPVERSYDLALQRLIAELGLEDCVKIEEAVYGPDKDALLQGATAVIYPSQGEPFGRTVFEAFAAGTLCLIPQNSGGAEYVEKFAPNMVYPDQSEVLLAEKMIQTMDFTGAERIRLVNSAKAWIAQNLNWPTITQQTLQIYEHVLA